MALAALPHELREHVLAHLPPPALCAVAQASRTLATDAQRALFHTVAAAPARRNLAVVRVLAASPALAALVRDFSLALPAGRDAEPAPHEDEDPTTGVFPGFYAALAAALRNMSGLTALALLLDPAHAALLAHARGGPALEALVCTFPPAPPVLALLAAAPNLRTLELASAADAGPVASALPNRGRRPHQRFPGQEDGGDPLHAHPAPGLARIAPRLAAFTGAPATALRLVPGRPVHAVHLLCGGEDGGGGGDIGDAIAAPSARDSDEDGLDGASRALLAALAQSTAPHGVELLTLTTAAPTLPFLRALAAALPGAAHVRVGTTYAPGGPWDAEFYDRVAEALGALPRLQTFELSGMCWPGARCAAHEALAEHAKHAAASWRPANLPYPPPPPVQPEPAHDDGGGGGGGGDAQDAAEPGPEYDFYDYLF